jgi:ketosteroid isomerase-like protein
MAARLDGWAWRLPPSYQKGTTMGLTGHKTLRFLAFWVGCVGLAASTLACARAPADSLPSDTTIRQEEEIWLKAITERKLDATVSYYGDGALLLAPNAPIARTKEEIRQAWMQVFASIPPGATFSAETTKVEVASAGDLGYTTGTFAIESDRTTIDKGKFVDVWKKQADGSWKAVIDIFNSDLPAPSTAK